MRVCLHIMAVNSCVHNMYVSLGKMDHLVPYETSEVTSKLIKTFNKSTHQLNTYNDLGHSFSHKVGGVFN